MYTKIREQRRGLRRLLNVEKMVASARELAGGGSILNWVWASSRGRRGVGGNRARGIATGPARAARAGVQRRPRAWSSLVGVPFQALPVGPNALGWPHAALSMELDARELVWGGPGLETGWAAAERASRARKR